MPLPHDEPEVFERRLAAYRADLVVALKADGLTDEDLISKLADEAVMRRRTTREASRLASVLCSDVIPIIGFVR